VVVDAEPLLDQVGDSWGGPELGRESERGRELLEPGENPALLAPIQAGLGAGMWSGCQALIPPVSFGGKPSTNRSLADSEDPGDVSDLVAIVDSLDGASAAPIEFLGTALGSHGRRRYKSRAMRTSLC
jgi:hypothetical protein